MGDGTIVVAVATHKEYRMPQDGMYLPLHVGAALHPDVCVGMQGDDTGESISEKNPYYCELTGVYWLWKNCDAEYKGIVHYRRHLATARHHFLRQKDRFSRVVSEEELRSLLEDSGIVLAKRRRYYIETVYDHYAHTFEAEQFDECRRVLLDMCPEYVPAWDRLMGSRSAHIFNMFVMRHDFFDAYCQWLFPLLFELERRIDPRRYDDFGARYLGRVSERLLDPWIETNGYRFSELPVVSPEPVNWLRKGSAFLLAKYGGKKYGKSF